MTHRSKLAALTMAVLAVGALIAGPADARRGGSFGSRGTRTYSAPSPTAMSPGYVPPVQRSMTQPPPRAPAPAAQQPGFGAPRPGFGGGFGGGLLGGLLAGGLIGGLMGHGWGGGFGGGGGGGMLTILIQLAVIGGLVWLLLKLFRRPSAAAQSPFAAPSIGPSAGPWGGGGAAFSPSPAPSAYLPQAGAPMGDGAVQIRIGPSDRDAFERLLIEVQDAFGHEDYARLRERTTPEVMSYLSEELSQNAVQGRRNDVTGTRLIQSDVAEAWSEGAADYATVALRYESIDILRDRATGAVLTGDPNRPTETTELWTFVRQGGGVWKLSAIQET